VGAQKSAHSKAFSEEYCHFQQAKNALVNTQPYEVCSRMVQTDDLSTFIEQINIKTM